MEQLEALVQTLRRQLPGLELLENEPMSRHTTFRIGGPARFMALPATRKEAVAVVKAAASIGVRPFFLGNGSNLLVADRGYNGFIVKSSLLHQVWEDDGRLCSESGIPLARLAIAALDRGLSGLEFAHGIPGSLGGAVVMNAGAYGGEMAQVLTSVTYLDETGKVTTLPAERCRLTYRHSIFSDCPNRMILAAEMELTPGDAEAIRAKMDDLMERRRSKQPLELPSAGSTFKRPEGRFAAALIEQCGLKGMTVGGAQVSEKHAGFLINREKATAEDMMRLIDLVREQVRRQTGVELEPEVKFLGF